MGDRDPVTTKKKIFTRGGGGGRRVPIRNNSILRSNFNLVLTNLMSVFPECVWIAYIAGKGISMRTVLKFFLYVVLNNVYIIKLILYYPIVFVYM